MNNFCCWNKNDALSIINPDVDAQPDAYFHAIHTDVPIRKQDKDRAHTSIVSVHDILKQFFENPKYALVPIIGFSGSGKSHLVRWLNLNIKRDKTREVLFVQKAKTNLRDIVKALILRLPDESQGKYLNLIQDAGTTSLTVKAQRTLILNNIQAEIVNDISYLSLTNSVEKEKQECLITGLSGLFIDPYIREKLFLCEDSFSAELAHHVFEKPVGYNPIEKRREFTSNDLPTNIDDITNSASATQKFLQFLLGNEQCIQDSIKIVNRHADAAISRCLNLSGDHLLQIMTEIRQKLKKQGKELILLIEDFARLQGLDRALLQSLLEQGNDELCTLRTAFACTTGFYGTLESTAQSRLSFVIDMDNPLGNGVDAFDLKAFVSRYMNAIRLGEERLKQNWRIHIKNNEDLDIESACVECEHKVVCHDNFGEVNGFGLYPFTHQAIDVMAHRIDKNVDNVFNARRFLSRVLQPITKLTKELENGHFPPKSLLEEMGGIQDFRPDELEKIKKRTHYDGDRHITLIALWTGEIEAINLKNGIQEAFGLQPLLNELNEELIHVTHDKLELLQNSNISQDSFNSNSDIYNDIEELSRWTNSAKQMSQQLANKLRPLIFNSVIEFINWDEINCSSKSWSGNSGLFRKGYIIFKNQSTQASRGSHINLTIPLDWNNDSVRTRTFSALSALLKLKSKFEWNNKIPYNEFVCLQECLNDWAQDIIKQILFFKLGPTNWSPAVASLEICVLGVLLSSCQQNIPSDIELLGFGFHSINRNYSYLSKDLEDIVDYICEHNSFLIETISDGVSATKGGQIGKFHNSNILVEGMKDFKKRGYKLMELPELPKQNLFPIKSHNDLYKISKKIKAKFDGAFKEELSLRLKWLADVDKAFGIDINENKISKKIHITISSIASLDISGSSDLYSTIREFNNVNFAKAVCAVRDINNDNVISPWQVSFDITKAKQVSTDLMFLTYNVLGMAKRNLESKLDVNSNLLVDEENSLKSIRIKLNKILSELKGI